MPTECNAAEQGVGSKCNQCEGNKAYDHRRLTGGSPEKAMSLRDSGHPTPIPAQPSAAPPALSRNRPANTTNAWFDCIRTMQSRLQSTMSLPTPHHMHPNPIDWYSCPDCVFDRCLQTFRRPYEYGRLEMIRWTVNDQALGCLAVGTPVTRRPPHRSLRAELPHKAPTSGTNAQSLFRIRMKGSHRWEPFRSQSVHTLSSDPVTLAPSPQRPEPKTSHLILESIEFPLVAWHGVVLEVSLYHAP